MKDVVEEIKTRKVILFGQTAKERSRRKDKKWVTLEEVEKKLGLR